MNVHIIHTTEYIIFVLIQWAAYTYIWSCKTAIVFPAETAYRLRFLSHWIEISSLKTGKWAGIVRALISQLKQTSIRQKSSKLPKRSDKSTGHQMENTNSIKRSNELFISHAKLVDSTVQKWFIFTWLLFAFFSVHFKQKISVTSDNICIFGYYVCNSIMNHNISFYSLLFDQMFLQSF